MFREIHEVSREEMLRREERRREEEERIRRNGYGQIKPETNITVNEAMSFWNGVFGN